MAYIFFSLVDVQQSDSAKFTGLLERKTFLYMVPMKQLLESDFAFKALYVIKTLAVTSNGDNVNQLHDIFYYRSSRLEKLFKSGVVIMQFKTFLNPCNSSKLGGKDQSYVQKLLYDHYDG